MRKKILSWVVCLIMITVSGSNYVLPVHAVEGSETPSIFQDGNRMSDDEFFGKWNTAEQKWDVGGKIDYSYAPGLKYVEDYIKAGDMYNAKEALLHYYRNRTLKHKIPTARSAVAARVFAEGIYTSETTALNIFSMSKMPKWYEFDVTKNITAGGTTAFLFHSINRDFGGEGTEQIASFKSKESGANAAYLEVKQGATITKIPVSGDMYIRGGKYIETNYGRENDILISEWWPSRDIAPALGASPADVGTRQAHIKFDCSSLEPTQSIDSAVLKLYGSSTEEGKEIALFLSKDNAWEENTINWTDFPVRVLSWKGLPGEYDWRNPAGAHVQFFNVNCRLWNLPVLFAEQYATGNEWYAQRGIEIFLDFIKDNGGLTYDWYNTEKRLNAAFRGDPYSVQLVFGALNSNVLDGVAFTSMLKFMWQEPTAMTGPLMEGQININGLAFAIDSLLRYSIYFPELKGRNAWVANVKQRIIDFSKQGFFEDGGYRESTSGYDISVLDAMSNFYDIVRNSDIEIPQEFEEFYKKFARAEMYLSRPDKGQYQWGDGGANGDIRTSIGRVADNVNDAEMKFFATDGREGRMPENTSYYLPVSKLGLMRTNWDAKAVAAFIVGRLGGSHGHRHVNHMELSAYGRQLLVDTGTSSYDVRHPAVVWQGSRTESHNSVEVNGEGQKFSSVEDLMDLTSTDMALNDRIDFFTCVSDAYDSARHTRKVSFIKDAKFFIVSDFLEPTQSGGKLNIYNQTWHMPGTAAITMDENTKLAKSNYRSGANLSVIPVAPQELTSAGLASNPLETYHVSYVKSATGNEVINTVLYPFENEAEYIQTEVIPVAGVTDKSAYAFSLKLQSGAEAIYYINNKKVDSRRFSWYDTDAETFYLEKNQGGNGVKMFAANKAKFVNQNGNTLVKASKVLSDISVAYSRDTADIETSEVLDLNTDYLRIYAPANVTMIKLNKQIIPFVRINGDVVIGKYLLELIASVNSDGTKSALLPEMKIIYPVRVANDVFSAELSVRENTTITASGDWNGIFIIQPMTQAAKEIGATSLGGILFGNYSLDKSVKLYFSGNQKWRAAYLSGNSYVTPETKFEEDKFEVADEALIGRYSAYIEGNDFSATYLKKLSELIIYSENTKEKKSDANPPSGGHIKSGGGNTVVTPILPPSEPITVPDGQNEEEILDIKEHWARQDILYMAKEGYVNGENGIFNPDRRITRAEVIAIISRMLDLELKDYTGAFADVSKEAWYSAYVEAALAAGIVDGNGEGFAPESEVTRAELSKIVVNAYKYLTGKTLEGELKPNFKDEQSFEPWEKTYIHEAYSLGLVKGLPDNTFAPKNSATRAEAVTMLKRILDKK